MIVPMAKIVQSELAPAENVRYILGATEFDLTDGPYETDDRDVLSNAESHPWLAVEYDEVEVPDLQAAADARFEDTVQSIGIQAGLDQKEPVETAGIAETFAAADLPSDDKDND